MKTGENMAKLPAPRVHPDSGGIHQRTTGKPQSPITPASPAKAAPKRSSGTGKVHAGSGAGPGRTGAHPQH